MLPTITSLVPVAAVDSDCRLIDAGILLDSLFEFEMAYVSGNVLQSTLVYTVLPETFYGCGTKNV